MVAVIGQAILPPRSKDLRNVALTDVSAAGPLMHVLADNQTLIFSLNTRIYLSTNYGSSFVSGDLLADSTWDVRGFIETPGGEMLVSLHKNNSLGPAGAWADTAGYVLRSTGWNPATGRATSWATVLTTSGPGCYCRGLWGFNQWGAAPTWSPDAGAIFISEYGPQTTTAATPAQSAHCVWRSLDDGATWTVVFSLLDHYAGTTQQVHLHGLCYDPWDARLYVTHGDGGGSPTGVGTVFYSDNPTAAAPTFTEMTEWHETSGLDQVTTIAPFEAGMILLPDGGPQGAKLLPRRGHRRLGTHIQTALRRHAAAPFIGATVTRRGYQQDPQPTSPIWMCFVEPSGDVGIPTIWVSPDGRSVREAYRHTVVGEINFVHGPDVNGKVVANITVSGRTYLLTADYVPPLLPDVAIPATPAVDVQTFTASGTWTKPPAATVVSVQLVAGGGGGGSGARQPSGIVACGGGGGSSAAAMLGVFPASAFGTTAAVVVGAGGIGGAAVTTDGTNGNTGSAGGASTFAGWLSAGTGAGGGAGTTNSGTGAATNSGMIPAANGASASTTGGVGGNASAGSFAGGGGAGGGVSAAAAASGGGSGGQGRSGNAAGGAAVAAATAGNPGTSASAVAFLGGGGGSGGGGSISGPAGAGGTGGTYGAAGGGGGGALNGNASGKGGDGAPGIVVVTSW